MNETERKAAAFDWLCAQIQAAYDGSGLVEIGDLSIEARMKWGWRDESRMHAEIHWTDKRGEPLDLLAAIEKAIYEHRAP